MREFLFLILFIIAAIILAPMIMGLIVFLLCAATVLILLAKFGLLPGFRRARYVGNTRRNRSSWQWKWKYPRRGNYESRNEANWDSSGRWYQTSQEGEEITLPETALRKEKDKK